MSEQYLDFKLPPSVISRADIAHLVGELERVDNEQTTAAVRKKAGKTTKAEIILSVRLKEFLQQNKLSIELSKDRTQLIKQMRLLKEKAPVIHMTFAVSADGESLQKLVQWLRNSIHSQAVLEVGLQPALVAGVNIRTPNHVMDFSMRGLIEKRHGVLVEELGALRGER